MPITRAKTRTKVKRRVRKTQVRRPIINASPEVIAAYKRTLVKARVERQWYGNRPMMTGQQIRAAIANNRLVRVVENPSLFRIAKPTPKNPTGGVQYEYLTQSCANLLNHVAQEFSSRCIYAGLEPKFLNITSMTRDRERQDLLIQEGKPAARNSTHGLGEAFDINVKWFMGNSQPHFQVIKAILEELHAAKAINLIDETIINGALHVARNPRYRKKQ